MSLQKLLLNNNAAYVLIFLLCTDKVFHNWFNWELHPIFVSLHLNNNSKFIFMEIHK